MNEKLLAILQGDERLYPHALEKQYLRIMHKIIELWHTPQANGYFTDLMVDKRGGRQGFPPEVATEIFRLSQVHERTNAATKPAPSDVWALADTRDLQVPPESKNYIYTPQEFLKWIEAGNSSAVGRFLNLGVDLNIRDERGWTPLMISSSNGHEEIVRLLIQSGADVQTKDHVGYMPLHWAAFNGHDNVVKLLIEHNSDPNVCSNFGWTPLMQAATRGHLAVVSQLIAGGADVNLASKDGWTALHKATANGHIEVVRFLLTHGANRNMQLLDGSTALSIATKNKNETIMEILDARGYP